MRKRFFFFVLIVIYFSTASWLPAQTASDTTTNIAFDMTDFPLWAKDLRRAEIIAFGSYPFAYFLSNFAFDFYRSQQHGWDRRYMPSPFTSAGGIGKTQEEQISTIFVAAGVSVAVALIDHLIMRHKRKLLEIEKSKIQEVPPVIIQKPLTLENEEP